MTKYEACLSLWNIFEVEADRETNLSVWVCGRKNAKKSSGGGFFNTFAEAKEWLIEQAHNEMCDTMRELHIRQNRLEDIKKISE